MSEGTFSDDASHIIMLNTHIACENRVPLKALQEGMKDVRFFLEKTQPDICFILLCISKKSSFLVIVFLITRKSDSYNIICADRQKLVK